MKTIDYLLDIDQMLIELCPGQPKEASRRARELALQNRLAARGKYIDLKTIQRWSGTGIIPGHHIINLAAIARDDGRSLNIVKFLVPSTT